MTEFNIEVDASSFYDWAEHAQENVRAMSEVLKELLVMYYNFIAPLTPYDKGFLQHSLMTHSEQLIEYPLSSLKLVMTGIDNPDANGWDYAYIQHISRFNHPIQGQEYYLKEGFEEAESLVFTRIATDYLTALGK